MADPGFGQYWSVNLDAPPGMKRPRRRGPSRGAFSGGASPPKRGRPRRVNQPGKSCDGERYDEIEAPMTELHSTSMEDKVSDEDDMQRLRAEIPLRLRSVCSDDHEVRDVEAPPADILDTAPQSTRWNAVGTSGSLVYQRGIRCSPSMSAGAWEQGDGDTHPPDTLGPVPHVRSESPESGKGAITYNEGAPHLRPVSADDWEDKDANTGASNKLGSGPHLFNATPGGAEGSSSYEKDICNGLMHGLEEVRRSRTWRGMHVSETITKATHARSTQEATERILAEERMLRHRAHEQLMEIQVRLSDALLLLHGKPS